MNFSPKCIDDIVIASRESRKKLDYLCRGLLPRSRSRSMTIVLSGPKGTGKTCLAKMLPAAIERGYSGKPVPAWRNFPYDYIDCLTMSSSGQALERIAQRAALGPTPGLTRNYVICDEIDNLSAPDQEALHQLTYQPHVVFIFTTNHRSRIDTRLLDDGIDLLLDSPSEDDLAQLAHRVAIAYQASLFPHEVQAIIKQCDHSWRGLVDSVKIAIADRVSKPPSMAAFFKAKRLAKYGTHSRSRTSVEAYAPQYIDEVLVTDETSRQVIELLVTGVSRAPPDQAMSILIYGRPNSGRRTLASLLPSAIEQCAYGDPKEVCGVSTFLCATGSLGLAQTAEISNLLRLKCLETVSQQRYIVLIDVERYSAAAIRNLKSLMNVVNAVFILVTSSIAQIDEFVRDRCRHKIHMRFPTPQQLHPLATSIVESLVSGSVVDVVDLALNAAPRTYSELFMATHDAITFVNEKNRIT